MMINNTSTDKKNGKHGLGFGWTKAPRISTRSANDLNASNRVRDVEGVTVTCQDSEVLTGHCPKAVLHGIHANPRGARCDGMY